MQPTQSTPYFRCEHFHIAQFLQFSNYFEATHVIFSPKDVAILKEDEVPCEPIMDLLS